MIIATTKEGEIFEAENAIGVVLRMKNTMWNAPTRKREYMLDVVDRVSSQTGIFPNPDHDFAEGTERGANQFLRYLNDAGVIDLEVR